MGIPHHRRAPYSVQQTATGPQNEESWAMREAARQRLAEQRKREREAIRWQQLRIRLQGEEEAERDGQLAETIQRQEEEHRRQHEERYLQLEERRRQREEGLRQRERDREGHPQAEEIREWLERHRRNQEETARRRQELADHTSQRRQRARDEMQERNSSTSGYIYSLLLTLTHSGQKKTDSV
jgi:hypothetical protein